MSKKYVVLACIVAISGGIPLKAQEQKVDVNYSVHAGVTFAKYSISDISSGVSREASGVVNGHLTGLVTAFPWRYVGFESGLSIMGLGGEWTRSEYGSTEVAQRTYWAQVPINIVGRFPFDGDSVTYVFAKMGGYVGYGIYGFNHFKTSYEGAYDTSFSFGESDKPERFDYGFNMGVGYQAKNGIVFSLNYLAGIRNTSSTYKFDLRNGSYAVSVGYRF